MMRPAATFEANLEVWTCGQLEADPKKLRPILALVPMSCPRYASIFVFIKQEVWTLICSYNIFMIVPKHITGTKFIRAFILEVIVQLIAIYQFCVKNNYVLSRAQIIWLSEKWGFDYFMFQCYNTNILPSTEVAISFGVHFILSSSNPRECVLFNTYPLQNKDALCTKL